jgi:hypothetical protein
MTPIPLRTISEAWASLVILDAMEGDKLRNRDRLQEVIAFLATLKGAKR